MAFYEKFPIIIESLPTLMLISFIIHSLKLKSERLEFVILAMEAGRKWKKNLAEPQKTFNSYNATKISLRFF